MRRYFFIIIILLHFSQAIGAQDRKDLTKKTMTIPLCSLAIKGGKILY